jgi:hypothetical protein
MTGVLRHENADGDLGSAPVSGGVLVAVATPLLRIFVEQAGSAQGVAPVDLDAFAGDEGCRR